MHHQVSYNTLSIGGGQKSQIFLATSFSELVFPTDYENQGEICWKSILKSPMAIQNWPPANLRIFQTSSKYIMLYTNRRRILCWFQKCITLYVYFQNFSTYGRSKSENGPFLENGSKRAISRLSTTINRKLRQINIQSYTFLKSA